MKDSLESSPLLNAQGNHGQRPLSIWTSKRFTFDPEALNVGRRTWYNDYTTIDWLHDIIKDKIRLSSLSNSGFFDRKFDAAQAWIVLTMVAMLTGLMASFIYRSINWLTDIRSGYCIDDWRLTKVSCCSSKECNEWVYWINGALSPIVHVITAIILSFIATILVTAAAYHSESRTYYYSSGSGIPQVKTILGGFVIRGCLGLQTLIIKSLSLILAVSSGLMIGQQGPIVHISCCIGNVVSRIFSKYNLNDGKRREILSAASAAGVSVAFGAPIGGVLFSLEEVSYYFPSKTMWRSFYCALISIITLKVITPHKSILLFESNIDADWHAFDIAFFVLIGFLGGLFGAFFILSCRLILNFEKSKGIYFKFFRVIIVTALTAILSYTLPFNQISNSELITFLFSECTPETSNIFCEIQNDKFGVLCISWIIKAFLMIITFGIHLPSGIFVPSMVVGALGGRIIAILAQNMALNFNVKIEPAIYAMVGAAATISGVTRMSVSLIIIMFEITGSLKYVVPLMISIMVSKWVSDAIERDSIYDTCIRLLEYPYLHHKKPQLINVSLSTVIESSVPIIQMEKIYSFYELELKLSDLKYRFPSGDGGFPIIQDGLFKGYIGQSDLELALYMIRQENDNWAYQRISVSNGSSSDKQVFDLSSWMDASPLMVSSASSLELVLELFVKLGIKTLVIVDSGKFAGLIHKKQLLGSGLSALEDLYSDTTNITIIIGKFHFAAHREYLSRYPFFSKRDLNQESISIDLPVPTKFTDCLVHMYIQEEGLALGFQEGLFIEAAYIDTFRNAIHLGLSCIVKECYKRFYGIWKSVIFQKEFNVENISLEYVTKLVENASPPFQNEEKALIILQWSLRRDDRINALISRYASTQNDLTPFLDLIKSFPKEKPLCIPVPTIFYENSKIQANQPPIEKKRKLSSSESASTDRGRSRSVRDRSPMYSPSESSERNEFRNSKSPRYYQNSDLDPSYYKPTSPTYSPVTQI